MLKVGVVGAGYWGKNLIRTFHSMNSAELKYIVDNSTQILDNYAAYETVIKTADFDEVVGDSEIDAVIISTPPITHFELAKKALLAGKHVMVEKPITLDVDHARELVTLAREQKLKLMVGHLLLYHPCVVSLKKMIDDGEIGDMHYLYGQRLNLGKVRKDENALQSFAPHDISVAIYLMGEEPFRVSATGSCYLQDGVEDVVFLNMFFPDNKISNIHVSWLDPHKVRRTTVVGSKKMVVFDDMESREKIKIYDKGVNLSNEYGSYGESLTLRDGNIYIPAIKMTEPLRCECEHFIDCIENDLIPRSDGHNGLVVANVLDAAQKSLKNNGIPIDIVS